MLFNLNCDGYFFNCDAIEGIASSEIINLIKDIKNRIVIEENLNKDDIESQVELEDFIYIMPPGTSLHRHIDVNQIGMYHIRFNLLLQRAEKGGIPIYAGRKKEIEEKSYILCRSGIDLHGSNLVEGNKPRIVISYGFSIPKTSINKYPLIFPDTENMLKNLKYADNNSKRKERYI